MAAFPTGTEKKRRNRDWVLGVSLAVLLDWERLNTYAIILLSYLISPQIAKVFRADFAPPTSLI